jgi:hypothetical protein
VEERDTVSLSVSRLAIPIQYEREDVRNLAASTSEYLGLLLMILAESFKGAGEA